MKDSEAADKLYQLVKQVPRGRVTTYGLLAQAVGCSPRQVGRLLHKNPDPASIPCHRVVSSAGKLSESFAFGGLAGHKERLLAEGIILSGARADEETAYWRLTSKRQDVL